MENEFTNYDFCQKLPTHEEVMRMYPNENVITLTDPRDIVEMERRINKKTFQPRKDELYSCNPNFNGVYSDPHNR